MKSLEITQKDVLTLIIMLLLCNILPLADIFIHQVVIPVDKVNFFGMLVDGGFVFDFGILLGRIVLNFIIISFWITGVKKRE